jgi:hypothetical protein
MEHGTYIGNEPSLQGKTAHLMPSSNPEEILAQFDDSQLQFQGQWLGFHWHPFPKTAFQLDPEVDFDG